MRSNHPCGVMEMGILALEWISYEDYSGETGL